MVRNDKIRSINQHRQRRIETNIVKHKLFILKCHRLAIHEHKFMMCFWRNLAYNLSLTRKGHDI